MNKMKRNEIVKELQNLRYDVWQLKCALNDKALDLDKRIQRLIEEIEPAD